MPIGSSMSTATENHTHKITMRVWYESTGGSQSETVDVAIDWSPQVLGLDSGTNPNPNPGGGYVSGVLGLVAWNNQVIPDTYTESNPKKFEVTLDCLVRALTSVEGTVGIVGGGTPSIYSAAVICQGVAS